MLMQQYLEKNNTIYTMKRALRLVHKDSVCLSEEEIQQEIKFTTAEKTASMLGGVYVGIPAWWYVRCSCSRNCF